MLSFKLSVCYPQSFYLSPPPIAFYLFNLFHVVSFYLSLSEISLPVIFCVIIIFFSFAGTFHLPAVISPTCIFYEIIPTIQITAQSISSDVYIIQVRYIIATVIHTNGSLCIISPSSNGNNIRMSSTCPLGYSTRIKSTPVRSK